MTSWQMTGVIARCTLEAHEVAVVPIGVLLGGRQLSLQVLHTIAVVEQLFVVALNLARPTWNHIITQF